MLRGHKRRELQRAINAVPGIDGSDGGGRKAISSSEK
jgi:hypothetical protein